MDIRCSGFMLIAAIVLMAGCSQKKSAGDAPPPEIPPNAPVPVQTIARIHWMGMKQISSQSNAASLMAVWNLPETRNLEQQTSDKLSFAPWRLLHRYPDTNAAMLFQPLLNDMVSNECCLEIRQATNQPEAMVLAIRLDDPRANLWQTNLARVLESLTGIQPVPSTNNTYGWSLKKHHEPDFLELARAGDWTIFAASEETNSFMAEIQSRIQNGKDPFPIDNTNGWLVADVAPAQFVPALGTRNLDLGTWNRLHLWVTGDGSNVLASGTADFSEPLDLDLKPWDIPTNVINWQVCTFTAVRGIGPWLKSLKAWNDLHIGPPPDQFYFWAVPNTERHSYFAAPLPEASNEVDKFTDWVLQNQGRLFPTNELSGFERSKESNGLQWKGLAYMWPFLRSITSDRRNFIYAGGFPSPNAYSISGKWLGQSLDGTNLVYYDSEETGPRVGQWIYMSQFARYVSHHAQLGAQSAAMRWLKAISPRLRYTVTRVTKTAPNQLSFTRRSSIGFTAIELNLMADWLESPEFPIGLHTLLAPPDAVR